MAFRIITRASHQCLQCKKKFQEKDVLFCVLVKKDVRAFEKKAYCKECWEKTEDRGFCFWKKHWKAKKKSSVEPEAALELWKSFLETQDELEKKLLYLLSLALIRKRWLKWHSVEVQNGQEYLVLEGKIKQAKELLQNKKVKIPLLEISKQEEKNLLTQLFQRLCL